MNTQEKMLYLSSQLMLLSFDKEHNQKEIEKVSEELAALQRQLRAETTSAPPDEEIDGFLEFTEKEILKMPKAFRKKFRIQGCTVSARKRTTGRYNCSYELRYAKKPYDKHPISASGRTIPEAKARFIEKLNNYKPQDTPTQALRKGFHEFAVFWFENFHAAKVGNKTYKNDFSLYNRHIKLRFEKYQLDAITPMALKSFLAELPGNGKTADDARSILNQIFETAVVLGKLKQNPLNFFVHISHERENGIELTQNEEIALLTASKDTEYKIIYAVILFCGLRINEYKTARIDGDFIIAQNSKRKNGKYEEKKIPICSPLRNIIGENTELPKRHETSIRKNYKAILPNHTVKDLRRTFSTHCVNCHVEFYAREKFLGHSVGKLDKPYVGNIDEYLLAEGKKLDNWYSIPQNYPKKI